MGKNYTLYINQDRFAAETNKSGLVNNLLAKHYAAGGQASLLKAKPLKRDPANFAKLKQNLDVRYEKKGSWGA